jgi:Spy/CpxP family protein refolding chaperone
MRVGMPTSVARRTCTAAAAACLIALASTAALAAAENPPTPADFSKLLERVEKLEQRNRELEARLDATRAAEARLKALEDTQQQTDKALASESEREGAGTRHAPEGGGIPEPRMQKQARQIEALEA